MPPYHISRASVEHRPHEKRGLWRPRMEGSIMSVLWLGKRNKSKNKNKNKNKNKMSILIGILWLCYKFSNFIIFCETGWWKLTSLFSSTLWFRHTFSGAVFVNVFVRHAMAIYTASLKSFWNRQLNIRSIAPLFSPVVRRCFWSTCFWGTSSIILRIRNFHVL
jgi:hypothetical protein